MLWIVMLGLAFSNVATSSFHSLYGTGEDEGGAQRPVTVTWPVVEAVDPEVVPLLEHAATAARPRTAVTVTAATFREPARSWSRLCIDDPSCSQRGMRCMRWKI